MKKVFISGSEGRISKGVLIPLLKELGGYEIVHFDKVLGDDLLKPDTIYKKLKGVDTIIHTAAIAGPTKTDKKKLYEIVNTNGSINLLKAANEMGTRKFIFFSSFSYYGADAWMRHRYETGPIIGEDVAVPRYLPIDEEHPSILDYDLNKLSEYNGKYYGLSKARVEKFARDNRNNLKPSFISMRLSGFSSKSEKYIRRKKELIKRAKRGIADMRKQFVYGLAGITTKNILVNSLKAILINDFDKYEAYNICEAGTNLQDVVKAYFPELRVTDRIFSNQKILMFMYKARIYFSPEREAWINIKTKKLINKIFNKKR